jgi:DNA-binding winged helix-turn-helix (wHTH) protein
MQIRFGPFTLDDRARQILRDAHPLHLSPKAFDLLTLLAQRRPDAIAKAEIHQRLWPDTFVSDINVAVLIAEIRTALNEDARHPAFVRTVHRFGYAFCGTAVTVQMPKRSAAAPACWVAWGKERAALAEGENTIGRDPAADIRIDAVGVSRRHAMVVLHDAEAILHDLASKNGTYVNGARLTSPVPLSDGAEFSVGPARVYFHRLAEVNSTQTINPASRMRSAK